MLRPRVQYDPNPDFDDVFLPYRVEKTVSNVPVELGGCIPPFFTRFMQWLKIWTAKADDNDYVDIIDDIV